MILEVYIIVLNYNICNKNPRKTMLTMRMTLLKKKAISK